LRLALSRNDSLLPGCAPAAGERHGKGEASSLRTRIAKAVAAQPDLDLFWDEPLARHTTFRVGGPVAALIEPQTERALSALLVRLRESRIPYAILGGGSNLLAQDGPMELVAIRLGRGFATVSEEIGDARQLVVGAALHTGRLVAHSIREGLSGLEFLTGIPGTMGGALFMNAGTASGSLADGLAWIDGLDSDGKRRRLDRAEISPRYRSMGLPDEWVILAAGLRVHRSTRAAVKAEVARIMAGRRKTQPHGQPSAGCIFKNPPGAAAGALIERAGLKGFAIGGAEVSPRHANWIVNTGGASASEILALIRHVEATVFERFGIQLEREVRILDED
jgi:UDP-N-acetylmuramate dehydrogenase